MDDATGDGPVEPGSPDEAEEHESSTLTRALDGILNRSLEAQWRRASSHVAGHRRRDATATPEQVAQRIVNQFVRDVSVMGAAGGAVAAVGRGGSGSAVVKRSAVRVVETGALLERAACMILGVAEAYGHDLDDIEVRRASILTVLGAWAGVSHASTGVAGTVSAGLGKRATEAIPMSAIHRVNGAVRKQILFKWSERVGTIRLGTVLPRGFGIAFGGAANYFIGRGLGAVAVREFGPPR